MSEISSNLWDQNIPGAAVPWICSIPEQSGDRAEGSTRWGFVSVEQGWTPQNHLGVAPGGVVALAVPGERWDSMIAEVFPTLIPRNTGGCHLSLPGNYPAAFQVF